MLLNTYNNTRVNKGDLPRKGRKQEEQCGSPQPLPASFRLPTSISNRKALHNSFHFNVSLNDFSPKTQREMGDDKAKYKREESPPSSPSFTP